MEGKSVLARTRRVFDAYGAFCKPYCEEIGLSVQAFEILLTISRRSEIITANDICKERNIKPTLMSFHIEKLVQAGLVERQAIEGNRRSIKLVCTPKAEPIIEKGKKLNDTFKAAIWEGITAEEGAIFASVMRKIGDNIDKLLNGGNK